MTQEDFRKWFDINGQFISRCSHIAGIMSKKFKEFIFVDNWVWKGPYISGLWSYNDDVDIEAIFDTGLMWADDDEIKKYRDEHERYDLVKYTAHQYLVKTYLFKDIPNLKEILDDFQRRI